MSIKQNSANYYLFNVFFKEMTFFIKFLIRPLIGKKNFKRTTSLVNEIYEKIRSEQLNDLNKMTFDQFVHKRISPRWCLLDNKLSFGALRVVRERKLYILEGILADSNTTKAIELGSGDGSNILWLAKKFPNHKFIGLELSETSVKLANAAAERFSILNVEFHQTDLTITESYCSYFEHDSFVFSMHTLEEMPRIFKIPLEALKNSRVKKIALLEPAYIFSFSRILLDITKLIRIINKDRLYGLIKFCKKTMSSQFNLEINDLGLGNNPINPTTLILLSRKEQ